MTQDFKKTSFWLRLIAFIIDSVIVLTPVFVIGMIIIAFTHFSILLPLLLAIDAFYNVFFDTHGGSTIGKRLLRMRVVNRDYQKVNLKTALLRETIGKYLCWITFSIGFLLILARKDRKGLLDIVAGTFVVSTDPDNNIVVAANQKNPVLNKILFFVLAIPIFIVGMSSTLFTFVGFPIMVYGDNMSPTYKPGQYVFAKQPFLIGRSDVVFYYAIIDGRPTIMLGRVIALPGETINLKGNNIVVDGVTLDQSRVIKKGTKTLGAEFLRENTSYKVPYNEVIIMGDNRENSIDSRNFGPVPRAAIIGKVAFK